IAQEIGAGDRRALGLQRDDDPAERGRQRDRRGLRRRSWDLRGGWRSGERGGEREKVAAGGGRPAREVSAAQRQTWNARQPSATAAGSMPNACESAAAAAKR